MTTDFEDRWRAFRAMIELDVVAKRPPEYLTRHIPRTKGETAAIGLEQGRERRERDRWINKTFRKNRRVIR